MDTKKATRRQNSGSKKRKKMALGRGIDALIPDISENDSDDAATLMMCDVDMIHPNPYQPRSQFDPDELARLSDSIRAQGILQPLLVRRDAFDYELVAGERRLRAAKMAGLQQVPVMVRSVTDTEMLALSIIENIQRDNLNPLEEADAYHRLMTEFNLTQEEAADRVGKSRSAVANLVRLRNLPDPIKQSIRQGRLSMGHARALLAAANKTQQHQAWKQVIGKGLSVRQTEALVKRLKSAPKPQQREPHPEEAYFSDLAQELSRSFGTKVSIKRRGQRGRVELEFYNNDDLDRLLRLLRADG